MFNRSRPISDIDRLGLLNNLETIHNALPRVLCSELPGQREEAAEGEVVYTVYAETVAGLHEMRVSFIGESTQSPASRHGSAKSRSSLLSLPLAQPV